MRQLQFFMALLIFCVTIFISGNCFAMQFSQPELISGIIGVGIFERSKGFLVENATSNTGKMIDEKVLNYSNKTIYKKYYDKGVARFGNGEDALYAHYDMYKDDRNIYFGGEDLKNTFPLSVTTNWQGEKIYKITTNSGITLYLITSGFDTPGLDYYLLGRLKNGKWIKYIDVYVFSKYYFGFEKDILGNEVVKMPAYGNHKILKDTIIIEYSNPVGRGAYKKAGEFRFKWDEAAQWFSVEQIKY